MSGDLEKEPIGIVAVSHCGLAEEMVRVAELIVGELSGCRAICFGSRQTVEEMTAELKDAIREVDRGCGVLILTDLFGGTPANISLSFLSPKVEVVCGMNLPMLIKLAGCRTDLPLRDVAAVVKEYGQRHISLASEILSRNAAAG
ncbi:MAG: PTS sugar transporter subunit IIA [Syntrophobacteraceae bacterium]|jgi:PTS system mannose-specific IIA component|nr:PTS sugar transporter subunit IIA [Syntrophobacteraceae bacterium]